MPRARTQSGSASCAETVTELATAIQAPPATSMAAPAIASWSAKATTAVHSACTVVPASANWSRVQRARAFCNWVPVAIAPTPMHDSRTVYVAAPSPPKRWATSGMSAKRAVAWKKKTEVRTSASFMRLDSRTYCQPMRIAPMKRSPGSTEGEESRFQRLTTKAATTETRKLSAKTYSVAGRRDDGSGHQRAHHAREVHCDRVERERGGQLAARHQLGHDRRVDRPAHRQARCRW